ncbi:phosphoribosylformylglycinamidine synthase subunit PurS, partial [Enterococcus faecalis]|uniref:phosphoribosylformylglycinamidine synthase subunit PurS n=1 Tax=Enterococcus faecalis TaxID=1351 RepID=UPI003D6A043C
MYFVKVYVTYKESILHPQGEAVKEAVHRLGFTEVGEIRVGKYFEMHVQQTEAI